MDLPPTYEKLVCVRHSDMLREAVEVQTVPMPTPGPGELLVRTAYSGVNAADYLAAAGRYLAATSPPFDMGSEAVGEVVGVGEGVAGVQVGDGVFAVGAGYKQYFTVAAQRVIPVPIIRPEIVSLGVSGLTASIALEEAGEMQGGETVLVTAAAGGTGSFVVQLAKLAGCTVIGTCGSADKVAFLRQLGCDRPVNYREESLKDVLKTEFPNGVDIVFESVGGEMYDIALNALAVFGRLIVIGAISEYESGPQPVNRVRDSYALLRKSASVRGFWLMHYMKQTRTHAARLVELIGSGKLQAAVDPTPFKGAAGAIEALEHLYAGRNVGKVVVDFTDA